MIQVGWKGGVLLLCVLLGCAGLVAAQELTVDGEVTATSFAGAGGDLTNVPDDVFHGFFEISCPAGNTCSVFTDCPAGFEVTGGGLFIESAVQAERALVTLHQTYRGTVTQWIAEATNGNAAAIDLFATVDCSRVPAAPLTSRSSPGAPPGLEGSRVLLACPQWDTARYVEPEAAAAAHFCPNHGLALRASGGGPGPIPLEPEPETGPGR